MEATLKDFYRPGTMCVVKRNGVIFSALHETNLLNRGRLPAAAKAWYLKVANGIVPSYVSTQAQFSHPTSNQMTMLIYEENFQWDYPILLYGIVGSLSGGDADVIRKWPFSRLPSFRSLLWTLHSCLQGQENVGGVRASSHWQSKLLGGEIF